MSVQFNCLTTIQLPFSINNFHEKKAKGTYCKLQGATLTEGQFSDGAQTGTWVKSDIDGNVQKWRYYQQRTGAICWDGSKSYATGRGACSHHGGVKEWTYGNFKQTIKEQEVPIVQKLRLKKKEISRLLGLTQEQIPEQQLLSKIFTKSILFIKGFHILNSKIEEQNEMLGNLTQQLQQLQNENNQLIIDIQGVKQAKMSIYEQKQKIKKTLERVEQENAQKLQVYQQNQQKLKKTIDQLEKKLHQAENQCKEEEKSIQKLKQEKSLLFETIYGIESLMNKNLPNRHIQYESLISSCDKSSNQSTLVSKLISNESDSKNDQSLPLLKSSQKQGLESEQEESVKLKLENEAQEATEMKKGQKKQEQEEYSYFNESNQDQGDENDQN